jgi:hypothetical protein
MSINRERLLAMLDKAHEGPAVREREFNMNVVGPTLARYLKQSGLEKTCQPDSPVNLDDDLADRYFAAGLETAAEIGLMCKDSTRSNRRPKNSGWARAASG